MSAIGIACFPTFGGSGVVATELAVGLAHRGWRVHLLASAPPSRALPHCERLTFHEVTALDYPLFQQPQYALSMASAMVELAGEHHLDLMHVHYAVPHAASAYLARQVLGEAAPRFVTTLHGTDVTKLGFDPVTRFSVARSDGVSVPSAYLRSEARRLLELPDEVEIEVIPNFVDTDHFAPADEPSRIDELFGEPGDGPVLFHVSNFRPVKRVRDLIEVLARVRATGVPARLVLVGDGPDRAEASQRARDLGLSKCVCFLGKRADFVEHLRHADAFLLPSETESFGVAALEALAAGVPVFGYQVGGLPELVVPSVGRLVPPYDVEALSRAVLEVLGDPAAKRSMAQAARAHAVRSFRPEPALDRYEAWYLRVLGKERAVSEANEGGQDGLAPPLTRSARNAQ